MIGDCPVCGVTGVDLDLHGRYCQGRPTIDAVMVLNLPPVPCVATLGHPCPQHAQGASAAAPCGDVPPTQAELEEALADARTDRDRRHKMLLESALHYADAVRNVANPLAGPEHVERFQQRLEVDAQCYGDAEQRLVEALDACGIGRCDTCGAETPEDQLDAFAFEDTGPVCPACAAHAVEMAAGQAADKAVRRARRKRRRRLQ